MTPGFGWEVARAGEEVHGPLAFLGAAMLSGRGPEQRDRIVVAELPPTVQRALLEIQGPREEIG